MSIQSQRELQLAREKLRLLEDRHAALQKEPTENAQARAWTLRSLKQLINQFIEDISRFEANAKNQSPPQ
jgi:hypothetical protein